MPTGAALLIAHRGELIFKEAAGRLEPNSILFLASSTKPITATVVAILAEQGILSLDDLLEKHIPEFKLVRRPLISEPGREFTYSGVAFGIAARVAEVVMRKPFEEVMKEVLLEPLGMKNTRFGFPKTPDDFRPENPQEGPFIMGGGGLVSTLDDVAIFYRHI